MVVFNYANRELTAKIVYYGPGLCGKTTNLEFIHQKISPGKRGQLLSLATETDRTLFFDLLPVDLGTISGFHVRLQLFTVPGQTYYNSTRKLVLRGADGVVFVADSRRDLLDANIESLHNLFENLKENNIDPDSLALVLQYNKQDLKPLIPVEELNKALNPKGAPWTKAVALRGVGVIETFKLISKDVITLLKNKVGAVQVPPGPATPPQKAPPADIDGQQIKIKSEKTHIPKGSRATREQIRKETSLSEHGIKSPAQTIETWLSLMEEGKIDMSAKETLPLINHIKKNLVGIIESNKKTNVQHEDLFRLLDKLAMTLKKEPGNK